MATGAGGEKQRRASAALMGFEVMAQEGWRSRHQGSMPSEATHPGERQFLEAFNVFDKTNRGLVTAKELKEMMHALGTDVTDAEIRDIFTEAGCRLDKGIPYESFSKLMGIGIKQKEEDPEDEMQHAFSLFDLDKDGFISAKEMKVALTKFGIDPEPTDKEVAQVLADASHGSEQKVSYDMFKRIMRGS
tara:strand:- start:54 stop:620 length:567 start_codon:yes stop_codon:yes gene_type:complete